MRQNNRVHCHCSAATSQLYCSTTDRWRVQVSAGHRSLLIKTCARETSLSDRFDLAVSHIWSPYYGPHSGQLSQAFPLRGYRPRRLGHCDHADQESHIAHRCAHGHQGAHWSEARVVTNHLHRATSALPYSQPKFSRPLSHV